jgi:hypothetical protein
MPCAEASAGEAAVSESDITMEVLSEAECLLLLASRHFGRVGVVADGRPLILPVNYVFDDGQLAFRTDPGAKLTATAQGRWPSKSTRSTNRHGRNGACWSREWATRSPMQIVPIRTANLLSSCKKCPVRGAGATEKLAWTVARRPPYPGRSLCRPGELEAFGLAVRPCWWGAWALRMAV